MGKVVKMLNICVICCAIVAGIAVGVIHEVDPWWIIYCWLGVAILSQLVILRLIE